MIERLNHKHIYHCLDLIFEAKDTYKDFYVTVNNERLFLNNEILIKKILKQQECYGLWEGSLQGILVIYREKGYRPYIKILAKTNFIYQALILFLIFNFCDIELYIKVKKENNLSRLVTRYGFIIQGNRGQEILLVRKQTKKIELGESHEWRDNT